MPPSVTCGELGRNADQTCLLDIVLGGIYYDDFLTSLTAVRQERSVIAGVTFLAARMMMHGSAVTASTVNERPGNLTGIWTSESSRWDSDHDARH